MSIIWPESHLPVTVKELEYIRSRVDFGFVQMLKKLKLPSDLRPLLNDLYLPLSAWLAGQCRTDHPQLVGINGSQGSGKSTLCHLLKYLLEAGFGLKSCVLSIDDLYLTHAERQKLAEDIHPLLATRGVPGTHDVCLGRQVFDRLANAAENSMTPIPRFNKASDDRSPETDWDRFCGRPDLILFEGWCVGARPQPPQALEQPVNQLEEQEDPSGLWRSYVNQQLAGSYQDIFGPIDLLLMLKVPGWQQVYQWRSKQEQQLIASNPIGTRTMDDQELLRFIMHYERLTRHQLLEMPGRADLVMQLDTTQRIDSLKLR